MKDYKLVLVIGNGFDLDLGLPTSYKDFIHSPFFYEFLENANILRYHRISIDEGNIFKYLQRQLNLNNWIDIEAELKRLATDTEKVFDEQQGKAISVLTKASQGIKDSFEVLRKQLSSYLRHMPYDFFNNDSYAIKLLKVLNGYSEMCEIITYNYTDIHQLKDRVGSDIKIPIDHVHGEIKDNSIIIGFQDDVEIDKSFSFMIKSFSPYFRSHNVRQKLLDADEIIFFGHSLGETDYHYFEDLFRFQSQPEHYKSSKTIRIFTYDENSRIDVLFQLRAMNKKRTDMLFDLNDFEIYRTKDDSAKIKVYLDQLAERLHDKWIDNGLR